MKKHRLIIMSLMAFIGLSIIVTSCDKEENIEEVIDNNEEMPKYGSVTFGANYHVYSFISTVNINISRSQNVFGPPIGTLINSTDSIIMCGEESNFTRNLMIGEYSYMVNIVVPEDRIGYSQYIYGTFNISENECEKIFIDIPKYYTELFECESDVIICNTEYENAPKDNLTIKGMMIEGDCLVIKFSAGGCNGSTWQEKLIDSGIIDESNPYLRTLRLSINNNERCRALIAKHISFNIKDLQDVDGNELVLNVSGHEILYKY